MTEEDLKGIEAWAGNAEDCLPAYYQSTKRLVLTLVAELRRLQAQNNGLAAKVLEYQLFMEKSLSEARADERAKCAREAKFQADGLFGKESA